MESFLAKNSFMKQGMATRFTPPLKLSLNSLKMKT